MRLDLPSVAGRRNSFDRPEEACTGFFVKGREPVADRLADGLAALHLGPVGLGGLLADLLQERVKCARHSIGLQLLRAGGREE